MDRIDTRAGRARLSPRGRPYFLQTVAAGITLGYRRLDSFPGTWTVRKANGKGGDNQFVVGTADDVVDADGVKVFDFDQAMARARDVALGSVLEDDGKPLTVTRALKDYSDDLATRDHYTPRLAENVAQRVRDRLPSSILEKPVSSLTARELKRWYNGLIEAGMTRASANRNYAKMLRAALNFAADHDSRITNRNEWKVGLKTKDDYRPVDQVLEDDEVMALVAAAYELDHQFGLLLEVLAVTGTRTKQATRLTVADLQADRLMMPCSLKGKDRGGESNRSVPITSELAAKLRAAAGTRPRTAALLLDGKGRPWNPRDNVVRKLFDKVAAQCGIEETAYALRHSYITRSIKAGVPITVVAKVADTSVAMIEKTYAAKIADHADELARRGLLGGSARVLKLVA